MYGGGAYSYERTRLRAYRCGYMRNKRNCHHSVADASQWGYLTNLNKIIMRYYKGKLMKDYKPKIRTISIKTFCRALDSSRTDLWVRGLTAYDRDGDKRVMLKLKKEQL